LYGIPRGKGTLSTDLREQLEKALGAAYTIDSELGGGGMSRVFAATETALGRRVVIKVLPPEMAEGLSVERFKREIQLAARLQNPHIVPVLTAGEMQGLPYYTMPFVNGHSLRALLVNAGPLPISEAISILRDVARALTCAHEEGVVHRDIKPDNVLLSGGSAVVTDFGVAKALSESKRIAPGGTLTHVGTSLGTPAYMAPEQAAADIEMDHRADIYSYGVMGYELLAGHPPFHGRTPQRLLAAQMGERPEPIGDVRVDTPPVLAQMLMRCLEKEPKDRPQSATELVRALEQVTSGGGLPAMPAILLGGRRRLWRALVLYALAFIAVAIVARAAVIAIGLPTWVFPAAVALMALGLPAILVTAFVHLGVQRAMTTSATTTGGSRTQHSTMTKLAVKAEPWVSWRRVAIGGVISLSSLALFVLVFMVTRAYGIGPAGSLLAAGKLDAKDRLLVADFRASGPDTSLGSVMTEAVRTDLGQSATISLVSQSALKAALERMQRPDTSRLSVALAREVAQREGLGAVVDGDIRPLGGGFVLTLRLLAAQSGDALATYQETIDGTKELLPAIDELTGKLRGKIGESLKTVGASPPLEQVTTRSLDALKKYDAGLNAYNFEHDNPKAINLFKEATGLDTEFAMAYRKLGVALNADGRPSEEADSAYARAYRFRDHLPERERNLAVASYFDSGPGHDRARAAAAWQEVLEGDSANDIALTDLAILQESRREFFSAEQLYRRLLAMARNANDSADALLRIDGIQLDEGRLGEADATLATVRAAFPPYSRIPWLTVVMQYARGKIDSAALGLTRIRASDRDAGLRTQATYSLANIALNKGHLREAEQLVDSGTLQDEARGIPHRPYQHALTTAFVTAWYREQMPQSAAILDSALAQTPYRSVKWTDRSYLDFAAQYAQAGRPDRARAILRKYAADIKDSAILRDNESNLHFALAEIALAEKRPLDALREFKLQDRRPDGPNDACSWCQLPNFGRAYDLAGMPDSTIAVYNRFLQSPRYMNTDAAYRAGIYKRLGELYEAKGERSSAITNYAAFVDLWKNADPDLQPKVVEVRKRLSRLQQFEPTK